MSDRKLRLPCRLGVYPAHARQQRREWSVQLSLPAKTHALLLDAGLPLGPDGRLRVEPRFGLDRIDLSPVRSGGYVFSEYRINDDRTEHKIKVTDGGHAEVRRLRPTALVPTHLELMNQTISVYLPSKERCVPPRQVSRRGGLRGGREATPAPEPIAVAPAAIVPATPAPSALGATAFVLMDLDGRSLAFRLPVGVALDAALSWGAYREEER